MRANREPSAPAAAGRIAPAAQAKASSPPETPQASPGRSRLPLVPLFRLAFALLLCLSALMLLRMAAGYRSSRAAYESLRAQAAAQTVPVTETADLPSPALPRPSAPARQDGGDAVPTPAIDWQALSRINPDIAAWLYCPDTALSYPVVQGRDNRYLHRQLYRRRLLRLFHRQRLQRHLFCPGNGGRKAPVVGQSRRRPRGEIPGGTDRA